MLEHLASALSEPTNIIALASGIAAWIAALFAYTSHRTARQSLNLTLQQEARRAPRLVPYLAQGYQRQSDTARLYAVSFSVSNPSDTDNAVVRIELQVVFRTGDGVIVTLRLPHDETVAEAFRRPSVSTFSLPSAISAHQTAAAWAFFKLPHATLGRGIIDDYKICVSDSHALTCDMDVISLREVSDEVG